jgi:ubiquinone/menaquinone biosynthesis C-methylase UbiE
MTGLDPAGTSDFSRVAGRYDATRDVPQKQQRSCYERLVHQGLLPSSGDVLDAGCGTGQISVVLAEMGYRVQGVDISPDMVALAQAKCRPEWCAPYSVADVRALPQSSGYFDAVVVSLLMHVEDWQTACRELVRVLRPGACIFQLNDAASFEHPVHRYFAQRADALGFRNRFIGLDPRDFTRLVQFFAARGCEMLQINVTDLRWERKSRMATCLANCRNACLLNSGTFPCPNMLAFSRTRLTGSTSSRHVEARRQYWRLI